MIPRYIAEGKPDKVGLNGVSRPPRWISTAQAVALGRPKSARRSSAPCRATREHDIVHKQERQIIDRDIEVSRPDHGLRTDLRQIIAI